MPQQLPLTGHAALAFEQAAVVPPPEPKQPQVWVVPQAVCPPSLVSVPTLQVVRAAPHTPLTTLQPAAKAEPEGIAKRRAAASSVADKSIPVRSKHPSASRLNIEC